MSIISAIKNILNMGITEANTKHTKEDILNNLEDFNKNVSTIKDQAREFSRRALYKQGLSDPWVSTSIGEKEYLKCKEDAIARKEFMQIMEYFLKQNTTIKSLSQIVTHPTEIKHTTDHKPVHIFYKNSEHSVIISSEMYNELICFLNKYATSMHMGNDTHE